MKTYLKMKYAFRFVLMEQQLGDELLTYFNGGNYLFKVNKMWNSDKFCAFIDFNFDEIDMDDFQQMVKEFILVKKLRKNQYGIWISSVTGFKENQIVLPQKLSDLHHAVGGTIDFSYVYIFPDRA